MLIRHPPAGGGGGGSSASLVFRPRYLGVTMGDKQSSFPGRGLDRNQHHICHAEGSQHLVVRPRCLGVTMGDKIFINQLKNPKIVRAWILDTKKAGHSPRLYNFEKVLLIWIGRKYVIHTWICFQTPIRRRVWMVAIICFNWSPLCIIYPITPLIIQRYTI